MDAVHAAIFDTTQRMQCWTCICIFQANVAIADASAGRSSLRRCDQERKIRCRFGQHILEIARLRLALCQTSSTSSGGPATSRCGIGGGRCKKGWAGGEAHSPTRFRCYQHSFLHMYPSTRRANCLLCCVLGVVAGAGMPLCPNAPL